MEKNVTEWLDQTADRFPDKTAVSDETEEITFRQLQTEALSIAGQIARSCGYASRLPIAVYMERSVKTVVAFMGVAYSGNFYSPLDVDMPKARLNKTLSILQPKIVIVTKTLKKRLETSDYQGEILVYNEAAAGKCDLKTIENIRDRILDTDLLCVLFTSGSTGMPKGVCITHRAIMALEDFETDLFEITEEDNQGNQASFSYVISMFDLYNTIRNGAAMYLIPEKLFSQPVPLLNYLKEKRISTIFWVPSAMIVISKLKAFEYVDVAENLKRVMFAGEVMPTKQLNLWKKYLPDCVYVQLYGTTEILTPIYHIAEEKSADTAPIPIGVPMGNTDAIVLDENDKLVVDENVIGELCVKGATLAAGYYNDMEKTKKVFVQNPLNHAYGETIYRTGDLVRYDKNGELIFVSRNDFQIKHRGRRIELGEIEAAAASLSDINVCACLYDWDTQRIVLFVDAQITKKALNDHLKTLIPDYMLPSKVVVMKNMPLNQNGKIDRTKLKEYLDNKGKDKNGGR